MLECLWQVWPVCAEHRLGMHPGLEDGQAVWRCAGGSDEREPGHIRAPVGKLEESYRSRRERRKRRKENMQNKQNKQNQRG